MIFFDYFFPKRLITKIRKNKLKQTGDPYETSLRLALAKISPKESITNAVENFWKPIGSSQVIGVHIRATDKNVYVAGSAAEKKLDTTLRKLKSEHSDAIILLCTDSKEVEQRIQKKFGDVLTTPKMLFSDRKPIHYGIDSNDRISMATSALVDLYLLARCHYLVYSSDSTFGLLARYLSQQPTGRFFDVTPSWGIFGQRS